MKERMKAKREKLFSAAIPTQLTIRLSSTDTKNENTYFKCLMHLSFFLMYFKEKDRICQSAALGYVLLLNVLYQRW